MMAALALSFGPWAVAQENALGPPEALQYPIEAGVDAPRGVASIFLRSALQDATDLALCQVLMTAAEETIPSPFRRVDCLPAFAEQVRNGDGIVHWASGARPLDCGTDCIGEPFMRQTQFTQRPNLRQAMLMGRLALIIDPPGPFNRDLTYSFDVTYTCEAENGATGGTFVLDVRVHDPVIGDPGIFESVLNFLTPGDLSRLIEQRIRQEVRGIPAVSQEQGPCFSVGVSRSDDHRFTSVVFDPDPVVTRRPGAAAFRDQATIHLLRIVRKPLPPLGGVEQTPPNDPATGQFGVYLNGVQVPLPPLIPNGTGAMDLPPVGGAVTLDYCRTIDVTDFDRLQVLFTHGTGDAVWSQFTREDQFGAGGLHTMTTGRTVIVPGGPGPPDPVTGRPTQTKPHPVALREFELVYTITYSPRGGLTPEIGPVVADPRPSPRPGGVRIPGRDRAVSLPGDRPVLAPDRPEPRPCRQI